MLNFCHPHSSLPLLAEEEDIYIRPRLQVRTTGPRRLLPRCARHPAVKNYRGRKYVHWNGGLQVWSKEVRCPVGVWSAVYVVLLCSEMKTKGDHVDV
jgi:hypothetical protein